MTSLEPVEGAWRLRVETEEGQEELLASFVIVATGGTGEHLGNMFSKLTELMGKP